MASHRTRIAEQFLALFNSCCCADSCNKQLDQRLFQKIPGQPSHVRGSLLESCFPRSTRKFINVYLELGIVSKSVNIFRKECCFREKGLQEASKRWASIGLAFNCYRISLVEKIMGDGAKNLIRLFQAELI